MKKSAAPDYVPALRFDVLTPLYDAVVRTTTRERRFKTALIAQARIQAGQRILDVGSGTGTLAIWIKQHEPLAEVTGVDGDPDIVSIAVRKARRVAVEVGFDTALSYHLPYEAERFDRVVSSLFFHHLTWQNKQRTAAEVFRVLKPGAELHVADWGRPSNALMRALFRSIEWLDGSETTRGHADGRLIELLGEAGFVDVAQHRAIDTVFGTLALYAARKPD